MIRDRDDKLGRTMMDHRQAVTNYFLQSDRTWRPTS